MRFFTILFISATLLVGCTTIGTGDRTLIKAKTSCPDSKALDYFPSYLVEAEGEQVQVLKGIGRGKYSAFERYMRQYNGADAKVAHLDIVVRDKAKTPVLLPTGAMELITTNVAKTPTDFTLENAEQAIQRENFIRARLLNTPRLPERTTLHHQDEDGNEYYFYYPQLEIDFTSSVLTPNPEDRFSYLGLVIRLDNADCDAEGNCIRFIDVNPKAADLVQFSRGNFQINTALQGKLTASIEAGKTMSSGLGIGSADNPSFPVGLNLGQQGALGATAGAETTFTLSETYASELKDALERQKVGIIEDGRTFIVDLHALREFRIGGTYTFDLLLEIPVLSSDYDGGILLEPLVGALGADIYLVGVVRHVYDTGKKGILTRVPESENDDVFEQVVYRKIEGESLWRFGGVPWVTPSKKEEKEKFKFNIFTNHEQASYYLRDEKNGEVVDVSSGKISELSTKEAGRYSVHFLPIIQQSEEAASSVLTAAPSVPFNVKKVEDRFKPPSVTVVGTYTP